MQQHLRAVWLAVSLLSGAALQPLAGYAETGLIQMDRAQALQMGRMLLVDGRPAPAQAIAEILLRNDAADAEAAVLMAAALHRQGDHVAARQAAQRAHLRGRHDATRFEGAMLAGRAEFHRGAYGWSQFWLRRASQVAPDAEARALAEHTFRRVRQINPLQLRFSMGLAQSSNINDGTSTQEIMFMGLPFQVGGAARALSGGELSTGLSLRYRIAQADRGETALTLNASSRLYSLSASAREQAPQVRADDFAFQQLEVGALHRFAPQGGSAMYDVTGTLGRQWYGGAPLGDHIRLSLAQTSALTERTSLRLSLSGQYQHRLDSEARSATRLGLGGELRHLRESGDQFLFGITAHRTHAISPSIRNMAVQVHLGYTLAEPVIGMRLSGSLDLTARQFPATPIMPDGRRDIHSRVALTAVFESMDYMGFSPSLEVRSSRTHSNLAIQEGRSLDVSLGVGSRF
jgi:hypothetical protein